MKGLNNFRHGVGQNAYHLVWRPKYAKDPFKFALVRQDCERFLHEIARRYGFEIYELQVMPDHVHLFVEIPPTMSVSKALHCLKEFLLTSFSGSILGLGSISAEDTYGVLESSSEVLGM